MKKLFIALAITLSTTAYSGEWSVNDKNVAVSMAENTSDVLGVDVCGGAILFAAPAPPETKEGDQFPVKAVMRIDSISPWNMQATAVVRGEILISAMALTPNLLEEMLKGTTMRIKWAENAYTRFDLNGLSAVLKSMKCDSDYFPNSDDADYFS
jgi:hypothetical protein